MFSLAVPLPAFFTHDVLVQCPCTVLWHPGEASLGEEGDAGFVAWVDSSKGSCELPYRVLGTQNPAPLCLGVYLFRQDAVSCLAALVPGSG